MNRRNFLKNAAGLTEFKEPTYTCCAIGPATKQDLDPVTGYLKLL